MFRVIRTDYHAGRIFIPHRQKTIPQRGTNNSERIRLTCNIMVKIGGSKKRKLSKKGKFCGNRGKCINFAKIRGNLKILWEYGENTQYASFACGMDAPASHVR